MDVVGLMVSSAPANRLAAAPAANAASRQPKARLVIFSIGWMADSEVPEGSDCLLASAGFAGEGARTRFLGQR
jgi:hypothetical protein